MYHVIPLYQSSWCETGHYYYDKPEASGDILDRLKRKYQAYKSVRLMENCCEPLEIYPKLFTVDYTNRKEVEVEKDTF
jgi:hypothetical protein